MEVFRESESHSKINFELLSLTDLIDFITNTHHRYVKEAMPVIFEHMQKVAYKHGERHAEFKKIANLFAELKHDMEQHMLKEEVILFPAIKQLETFHDNLVKRSEMILLETPVQVMETEHEIAGHVMQEIRKLTNNNQAPDDGCTTYKLSFDQLKKIETDLHRHMHLENNILFPKAIELQKKLMRVT